MSGREFFQNYNPRWGKTVLHNRGLIKLWAKYEQSQYLLQIDAVDYERTTSEDQDDHPLKLSELGPRIFPCRTTHRRLFPSKHSFSYSYLLVGFPIGWRGSAGSLLSSEPGQTGLGSLKTWFSVHAEDYLERGHHVDGLAGKLRDYLRTQNLSVDDYAYAYLATAPKFLGYSFNPVSFWYLYDENQSLSAMILEVNNTFDERRMYFLPRNLDCKNPPSPQFRHQWDKDFHVSPFNDRDGSYSLSAIDPFEQKTAAHIDNTIVLHSREGKPKIVTRLFSVQPAIDPARMSRLQTLLFVARWWWVGFMTNPRILREARVLWVKQLRVFYRPEVLTSGIGRSATEEEASLEPFFRAFLRRMADMSRTSISYSPAAGSDRAQTILIPHKTASSMDVDTYPIEVKVITPAFYAEIAREPAVLKPFERFSLNSAPGQAMVYISDPARFRTVLEAFTLGSPPSAPQRLSRQAVLNRRLRSDDNVVFAVIKALRDTINPQPTWSTDKGPANFDAFVRAGYESAEFAFYESICLKIHLADRLAFGLTSLLILYVRIMWLIALILTVLHVNGLVHATRDFTLQDVLSFGVKMLLLRALERLIS
ncbi:uncharacterized protein Z518_09885 [Rhinocladiella mackenziei CBS 650.93]|uniref:Rhinocladiella mackenziei CBS 650.93 unplaced genomic scaffold supercont1.8, whole genome shotgun sequence n=1 Tax=Rhinocladiella mackenziei CBS 650.93 TaxID=1442369 RepID=A0A0D2IVU4_9EURO|nr:uncharacterized protein Z518_09885 [Rhinocladiella mackenziei CBS 650.93]KIX00820.1 hypothetical protein Z518_09885 [Rhinocladiella mackenziei CBS 650.93]